MDRRNLPLMLASQHFANPSESEPFDRIRFQKAIFLVQMRGPSSWREMYDFVPWNWGPFSKALARDVDSLLEDGLLETAPVPGRSYPAYRTTWLGEEEAKRVVSELDPDEAEFIRQTREYVTSRSFNRLLREVYAQYPTFAVNSQFSG